MTNCEISVAVEQAAMDISPGSEKTDGRKEDRKLEGGKDDKNGGCIGMSGETMMYELCTILNLILRVQIN